MLQNSNSWIYEGIVLTSKILAFMLLCYIVYALANAMYNVGYKEGFFHGWWSVNLGPDGRPLKILEGNFHAVDTETGVPKNAQGNDKAASTYMGGGG